jgi:hypothetical protein
MIVLHGTLRQAGQTEFEGVKKTKLWLEHTTPRENGPADLKLEELYLENLDPSTLPPFGSEIGVQVRPYAVGRAVKYAAVSLVGNLPTAKKSA